MGNARRAAVLAGIAAAGLALASLDTPPRTQITLPPSIHSSFPFFIGAWVGPRTAPDDPEAWRRFARAGLEVSFRPLEDSNDRAHNLATLALLDSMGLAMLPRDSAVHPDETRRPGWRERVRDVVAAYRGHRSLFGYFVADEPQPDESDSVAAIAAEFRARDPRHSAYVNLLPPAENATDAAQARWRTDAARMIERGHLGLWSWSAYSQRRSGEGAAFLLTQRNALQVGRATGVPGIAVLQFTGFADLDPLPRAQLDYLAAESIAHGARGIVWFTWWTPDPNEPGQHWRGGAIEYDGTPTARADTLALVNERARALAGEFLEASGDLRSVRLAHLGGAMPKGAPIPGDRIPGLLRVAGGPSTVAARWFNGDVRWLVINRDRAQGHTFTLGLAQETGVGNVFDPDSARWHAHDPARRSVVLALPPGGSAVLGIVAPLQPRRRSGV